MDAHIRIQVGKSPEVAVFATIGTLAAMSLLMALKAVFKVRFFSSPVVHGEMRGRSDSGFALVNAGDDEYAIHWRPSPDSPMGIPVVEVFQDNVRLLRVRVVTVDL